MEPLLDPMPNPYNSNSISDKVVVELRKIIRAIDLNSKSLVRRVGLTGPQLVILKEIGKCREASAGRIAREVSLSQATVTGILERLSQRGLVARNKDGKDRRQVLLTVTPAGEELLAKAPPLMQETFVQRVEQLPAWEQTMILSSLEHLSEIMDTSALKTSPADRDRESPEEEAKSLLL